MAEANIQRSGADPASDSKPGKMAMAWWTTLKTTWSEFSDDDCSTMAAALAYYAVFSLPSVLLIMLFVSGLIFGQAAVAGEIEQRIGAEVGPVVAAMVQGMAKSASQNPKGGVLATVLGVAGLLYAATNVFAQLQTSMNRAWNVKPRDDGWSSMAKERFKSFLLIVGAGILILITLGAATTVTRLAGAAGIRFSGWLLYPLEIVVSWFVFALLFAVLFKALPDAQLELRDVSTGAAVTATFFIAGKFLIGLYLSHMTTANAYGAAGALALLLLWMYCSAVTFLFGVELMKVWAQEHGRAIEPEASAVRVTEQEIL